MRILSHVKENCGYGTVCSLNFHTREKYLFFHLLCKMKSKVHTGVGVGLGLAAMMSISTSFKYRFSFSGLAKKWREISIHKIYIFICDSWELFGGPILE